MIRKWLRKRRDRQPVNAVEFIIHESIATQAVGWFSEQGFDVTYAPTSQSEYQRIYITPGNG